MKHLLFARLVFVGLTLIPAFTFALNMPGVVYNNEEHVLHHIWNHARVMPIDVSPYLGKKGMGRVFLGSKQIAQGACQVHKFSGWDGNENVLISDPDNDNGLSSWIPLGAVKSFSLGGGVLAMSGGHSDDFTQVYAQSAAGFEHSLDRRICDDDEIRNVKEVRIFFGKKNDFIMKTIYTCGFWNRQRLVTAHCAFN